MRTPLIIFLLFCFVLTGAVGSVPAIAQNEIWMPKPGTMVGLSPAFAPASLKGLSINPKDPFKFDFIIERGHGLLNQNQKNEEYTKLIKYFLASLAVAEEEQWVNLSPYEKDRIISKTFGLTQMGRDLLAEDYVLKQITASLIYPEDKLGKEFWQKIFTQAQQKFGTTKIPINTFNKVWIIPDKATVYEKGNTVYILKSHLKVMLEEDYLAIEKSHLSAKGGSTSGGKVMLEEDYLAMQKNEAGPVSASSILSSRHPSPRGVAKGNSNDPLPLRAKRSNALPPARMTSQIIRELILPELEKEVNEGKNFAALRQVYSGMLLATWYKRALKQSILSKLYANKGKVKGISTEGGSASGGDLTTEKIYEQYLAAYKKGVFNYIKEEPLPSDGEGKVGMTAPRKYFSGGMRGFDAAMIHAVKNIDAAQLNRMKGELNLADLAQVVMKDPDALKSPVDKAIASKDYERASLREKLEEYFSLKESMVKALDKDDEKAFRAAYEEILQVVGPLARDAQAQGFDATSLQAGEIYKQGKIHPILILGDFNPQEGMQGFMKRFGALYQEILAVGNQEFSIPVRTQIDAIIGETVDELFDGADQAEWRKNLERDIRPYYLSELIDPMMNGSFQDWRENVRNILLNFNRSVGMSGGMFDPLSNKIYVQDTEDSDVLIRLALKHEIFHYLAHQGIVHVPYHWEDIMHAVSVLELERYANGNKDTFEKVMHWAAQATGEALALELFRRGQALAANGSTGFMINPGTSDKKAGYFATDYLLSEARRVYEEKGGSPENLLNDYAAQRAVGVLIAGVISGMKAKDPALKPLRLLKDFFDILWERYGEDDSEQTRKIIELSEKDISAYLGPSVELFPVPSGFFWSYVRKGLQDTLNYIRTTLKPRFYDGDTLQERAAAARERGLGETFLARAKVISGFRDMILHLPELLKDHQAITPFWDTLLFTRTTGLGLTADPLLKSRIGQIDQNFRGSDRWIMRVLRDRYDFGESDAHHLVAQALLSSLPMHLQFLDSLLYRRYHYDTSNKSVADPRLQNSEVMKAVRAVMGNDKELGWGRLLFRPDKMTDAEILQAIQVVWTEYEQLYQRDVAKENLWRAYERKMKEEKKQAIRDAFEDALRNDPDFEKKLKEYIDQLLEHAKQAIKKAVEEDMKSMEEQFGSGQPSGMPMPGQDQPGKGQQASQGQPGQGQGQLGQGQSGLPGGQAGPSQAGDLKDMEGALGQMGNRLKDLENRIGELSQGLSGMQQKASGMGGQSSADLAGKESVERNAAGQDMKAKSGEIQDEANDLLNQGRAIASQGEGQRQQMKGVQNNLPSPEEGKEGVERAGQLDEKTQALLNKLQELQDKANQLNKAVGQLAERLSTPSPDGTKIDSELRAVERGINSVRKSADETKGAGREVNRQLHQLQESIAALENSLKQAQEGQQQQGQEASQTSQGHFQRDTTPASENTSPGVNNEAVPHITPEILDVSGAKSLQDLLEQATGMTNPVRPTPRRSGNVDNFDALFNKFKDNLDLQTGLTAKQREEMESWKRIVIKDGKSSQTIGELIRKFKEQLDQIAIPMDGRSTETGLPRGQILDDFIAQEADETGFMNIENKDPFPFSVSLLLDIDNCNDYVNLFFKKYSKIVSLRGAEGDVAII